MFRISDILKKHKKTEAPFPDPAGEKAAGQPAPSAEPSSTMKVDHTGNVRFEFKPETGPGHHIYEGQGVVVSRKNIPKEAAQVAGVFLEEEAEKATAAGSMKLYNEALEIVRRAYTPNLKDEPDFFKKILAVVEKAITLIAENNRGIHILSCRDYPSPEDGFYYHITNVFFMSIDLGIGMGLDRSRLAELGAGALLHDIGMRDLSERDKQEPLDNCEYSKIKQHPEVGVAILKKMNADISKTILDVVRQEHERSDGSGYPDGAKSEEISEDAQVVGLIDSYEAMIHYRPYRLRYTPLEAMSVMLKNKNIFGPKIIKALILRVGVFPLGTIVVLNTKEIGIVINNQPELPFRPVVRIIFDPYGRDLKNPKEIDLAENPIIYIDDCVKEDREISDYKVAKQP